MSKVFKWIKENIKCVCLALYVPLYLIMFFILEGAITEGYWVSWCPLDDVIPFCEYFVVFYVMWFPVIGLTGLYLLFFDQETYKRYMWFIAAGFSIGTMICAIFPSGQDLRPVLTGENFFQRLVMSLYRSDTNTNVIPSIHVVAAINVVFAVFDSKKLRRPAVCVAAIALATLISASTVLIKQHSILDIFAAMALCAVLWPFIYLRKKDKKHDGEKVR